MNLAELAGKNMSGQKCEIGIAKNKQTRNFICGVEEVAIVYKYIFYKGGVYR